MYKEKFDLTGRTAVITGGPRGIGLACAEAVGEAGAKVVITSRTVADLEEGQKHLRDRGIDAHYAVLDVSVSSAVDETAAEIEKEHGATDILITSAGVAHPGGCAGEEVTDEIWYKIMKINLDGAFFCNRAFGKRMLERGSGSIVNIGSISAMIVNRPQNQSYYNASKAGVHQLTKCLAAEWAERGVRVNAIAPGYVATPMIENAIKNVPERTSVWMEETPAKRFGRPDEVGSIALFLASDASSMMTGSVVVADGGYTLW